MKNKPSLPNLDLGFLTEKKVQSKLIENGFSTFDPLDEGGTVDLLSYKKISLIGCKLKLVFMTLKQTGLKSAY